MYTDKVFCHIYVTYKCNVSLSLFLKDSDNLVTKTYRHRTQCSTMGLSVAYDPPKQLNRPANDFEEKRPSNYTSIIKNN